MKKRFGNILSGGKRRGAVLLAIAAVLLLALGSIAACGEASANSSAPVATSAPEINPANIREWDRMLDVVGSFASAYVDGDEETLHSYLTEDYSGTVEIYSVGRPRIVGARGFDSLQDVFSVEEGVVYPVRVEFMDDMEVPGKNEDVYACLSMEAVKTLNGWRIRAFSLDMPAAPGEVVAVSVDELPPSTETDYLTDMLHKFVRAYTDGDEATLRSCLTDGYDGAVALDYDDEPPHKITLRGPETLDGATSVANGGVYPVKAELMVVYGDGEADVRFSHLDIEVVKTADGWRVQAYSSGQGK